jgi:gliding motility associated protien GldN
MTLKKIFFFLFAVLVSVSFSFGQGKTNLLNAKTVGKIGVKSLDQITADATEKPLAYGVVKDDDILWSKIVWEHIDLNQKINHPYYYPIDSTLGSERLSLYNTITKGLKKGKFKIFEDSYFIKEKSVEKVDSVLVNICTYNKMPKRITVKPFEITSFAIKGMWFFDKLQGELKYRLLAIAPLVSEEAAAKCVVLNAKQRERKNGRKYTSPDLGDPKPLYWVYYPEIRQLLHDAKVFNPENGARPISFDHLLNARRFSSVIVQEENMYGNRSIKKYNPKNSLFQLLEANKIKEDIRNREIDMWNY